MTLHLYFSRSVRLLATAVLALAAMVTTLAPSTAGAQDQVAAQDDVVIDVKQSCLGGRGRIDVLLVPKPGASAGTDKVELSVKVGNLTPRTRQVSPTDDTRVTVTGRPNGALPVTVTYDGEVVASKTVTVNCSPDLTSPEVKTSCLAGRGRVDVLVPKGTDYVVSFPELSDRAIKGVDGRLGRATWTGRPDGVYTVKAVSGSGVTTQLRATVACAVGPEKGELAIKTSCLANRGRLDITYRAEKTGRHEVVVGSLAPRVHTVANGAVVRETVTGRPDGSISVAITEGGSRVDSRTVTVDCTPTTGSRSLNLEPYDNCPAFLGDIKTKALEEVTAFGLYGGFETFTDLPPALEDDQAADPYSETNNQVAGVDEPDLMKTNGKLLVVAEGRAVRVYTVAGGSASELHKVTLDRPVRSLFFDGSNIVAISDSSMFDYFPQDSDVMNSDVIEPGWEAPTFTLTRIPLGAAPTYKLGETSQVTFDGYYLESRLQDGRIRMVSTNAPQFDWANLEYPYTEADLAAAEAANRQIIQDSRVSDWLGSYEVTQADGTTTSRTISNCRDMFLPDPFAGFSSLAVTTIDPATLTVTPGPGLLNDATEVYASADSLYIATSKWTSPDVLENDPQTLGAPLDSTFTTQIHKFDTTQLVPTYKGSGRVRGHLLNQFAMHEHEGRLFVASTDGARWWGNTEEARSYVSVLEPSNSGLAQVGQVGNLGVGERIYSVRFMEDVAYVVTFRRIDPLYVIDLREPTAPKVTGELKIPGYSAYLHPLGDGRLLGVGADADAEGRVLGAKLSLFDVRDPANPTEEATWVTKDAYFLAEGDHHAFTWWAPRKTAILPMTRWTDSLSTRSLVFNVSDSEITNTGEVGSSAQWASSLRSTVIGDHVWTLTYTSLVGNSLDDLSQTELIEFR